MLQGVLSLGIEVVAGSYKGKGNKGREACKPATTWAPGDYRAVKLHGFAWPNFHFAE